MKTTTTTTTTYGAYLPVVAHVVVVVHTISYICDSIKEIGRVSLVCCIYISFIYKETFCFIGLWYILYTGQDKTLQQQ